jgi:Trk-type K+ transport system membrane component
MHMHMRSHAKQGSKQKRRRTSSVQLLVFLYLATTAVATVLLLLPWFHQEGATVSFIDALFIAASSVSVTGLDPVTISTTFNHAGLVLMLVLFHIGGIGIMTLNTLFWLLLRQRIGLERRMASATDQNSGMAGIVVFMRSILLMTFTIELLGSIVLTAYNYLMDPSQLWYSTLAENTFAVMSAFTNAGFFLRTDSMASYAQDYFYQSVIMCLIILGAIGFPVWLEIKLWVEAKWKGYLKRIKLRGFGFRWTRFRKRIKAQIKALTGQNKPNNLVQQILEHRPAAVKASLIRRRVGFSLFTKITVLTFGILLIIGTVLFIAFEWNNFLEDKSWSDGLFYALFQSVATRSGGLTTMNLAELSLPTILLFAGLMFIGASPSSVGGGIRTTTLFVLLASVLSFLRGYKETKVFGRELETDDIRRAQIIFFGAVTLVFVATLIIALCENQPLEVILFEVCSAFGTSGMPIGNVGELSVLSKLVLIITMLIGRIGIVNLLLLRKDEQPVRLHYPKEHIVVG